jgi:hypothetical protein
MRQYIFADFTKGIIYYKDGSALNALLNYNLIIDEMQYLDDKDKKQTVFEFDKIDYISIAMRQFIPLDNDFAEIIIDNDAVNLALKRYTKVSGTSRSKVNKIIDRKEALPNDVEMIADSAYYLIRMKKPQGIKSGPLKGLSLSQNRVVEANYNGFLKVYSQHKEKITEYINNKDIDFKNSDDIIELTEYCNGL